MTNSPTQAPASRRQFLGAMLATTGAVALSPVIPPSGEEPPRLPLGELYRCLLDAQAEVRRVEELPDDAQQDQRLHLATQHEVWAEGHLIERVIEATGIGFEQITRDYYGAPQEPTVIYQEGSKLYVLVGCDGGSPGSYLGQSFENDAVRLIVVDLGGVEGC